MFKIWYNIGKLKACQVLCNSLASEHFLGGQPEGTVLNCLSQI